MKDNKLKDNFQEDSDKKNHKRIFIVVTLSLLVILIFVLVISFSDKIIGGKAILSLETDYIANESLKGTLSLSLKQGELIPADSIVKINMAGEIHEYKLSELVNDKSVEGNFYAEDKSLTGTGLGYGTAGTATIYPNIDFVMQITSSSKDKNKDSESTSGTDETSTTNTTESSTTPTTETPSTETSSAGITSSSSISTSEKDKNEKSNKKDESSTSSSTETSSTTSSASTSESSSTESSSESTTPIIGQVSAELEREVSASVSKNSPYTYTLSDGETAKITSSSQKVDLNIENNIATITTDYYETGASGFGSEYLGDSTYKLDIDLSKLDLTARDGDMTIDLVYGEVIITSVSTALNVVGDETNEDLNVSAQNITETNLTAVNVTANLTIQNLSQYALTESELFLLKAKTGSTDVKITKSEIVNERLIIKFEIGSYWAEMSYNPESSDLDAEIEFDRMRWIKHLAQTLGEKNDLPEKVDKYIGNYNITG